MLFLTWLACAPAPVALSPEGSAPEPPTAVKTRALAPEDLAREVTEATGAGRLVHLWATWCQPCVAELPAWRAVTARHPDVDVRMIDVDAPAIQASRAVPLLQARGLTSPTHLLLQAENPVRVLAPVVPGWVGEIPHTVAIGPDGSVRGTWPHPLTEAEIERALRQAQDPAPRDAPPSAPR